MLHSTTLSHENSTLSTSAIEKKLESKDSKREALSSDNSMLLPAFSLWRKHSKEKKLARLNEAFQQVKKYIKQASMDLYLEDFSEAFKKLSSKDKFEFIKNILLISKSLDAFFGVRADCFREKIMNDLQNILSDFSETQRFDLARSVISIVGFCTVKCFHLTTEQHKALDLELEKQLNNFLPQSAPMIEECIKNNDRERLRYLIYLQFSGQYLVSEHRDDDGIFSKLKKLLKDPKSNLIEISEALKQGLKYQKEVFKNFGWYQTPAFPSKRPPYWKKSSGLKKDVLQSFSHGGGFFHICQFLAGQSKGYRLENPGVGIQVTPLGIENSRDKYYAERTPTMHFDLPARLSGKIKIKYLDSAPNEGYEAGLRFNFIKLIEDIVVTRLDTNESYKIGTVMNRENFPCIGKSTIGLFSPANVTDASVPVSTPALALASRS